MPVFKYKAKNEKGKSINGLVEAPSTQAAIKLLRDKKIFIISLKSQGKGVSINILSNYLNRITLNDTYNFTRQLATLITAGLSLPESLSLLRTQNQKPALEELLNDIEHNVVSGGSLTNALAHHPEAFSPIYISLVKAGEASGTLDTILARLAESLENERDFRAKIKGVLMYPAIVLVGMVVVIFILMTFVLPKLTDLYKDFGVSLPITTRLLMGISDVFVHYWWLMIAVMVGGVAALTRWQKTEIGKLTIDSFILKIPVIGKLQKEIILAEFSRTLAMLIVAGIHILDGLTLLKDSVGNVKYKQAVRDISLKIEKGFPMGETFAQNELFPPIVYQMIKTGEETGKLDETLNKLADYFQKESEYSIKNLTALVEPLIMVVLGLGVGFIVFSIITPIYSLTNQIK